MSKGPKFNSWKEAIKYYTGEYWKIILLLFMIVFDILLIYFILNSFFIAVCQGVFLLCVYFYGFAIGINKLY